MGQGAGDKRRGAHKLGALGRTHLAELTPPAAEDALELADEQLLHVHQIVTH